MNISLQQNDNTPLWGTPCKNCWFATYINNTQNNCEVGIIDKLKDKVVECYDNDKEFYFIKDKFCPYFIDKTISLNTEQ